MRTSKQLSNISHLHVTLYNFLQKKSKFKQNHKTKKNNLRGKIKHNKINRLMMFDYENLLVIGVLFDLNLKNFRICERFERNFGILDWK